MNKLTVVIPHFNGIDILSDCLNALYQNKFADFVCVVIDNGSNDGSQDFIKKEFKQVKLIENKENLGYAGACNQGIEISGTPFVLLLNNDTAMPENFLQEMLKAIEQDEQISMVQPKILSIQNKDSFDYSGAAGGELDIFGYPFARGRVFDEVEKDNEQYDSLKDTCFWTSGCALLLRKKVTDEIGMLDEDFFAHQEEIDLNWRAQLAGYRNIVTTKTYIYHYSGYTLRKDNQHKMYLNHRNNLIMMIKNYSWPHLVILFPMRIFMELLTIVADSILWDRKRSKAVIQSLIYIIKNLGTILGKRREIQKLRRVKDSAIVKNMYCRSIIWDHFILKKTPNDCISLFRK